jgi:hypothetical protein
MDLGSKARRRVDGTLAWCHLSALARVYNLQRAERHPRALMRTFRPHPANRSDALSPCLRMTTFHFFREEHNEAAYPRNAPFTNTHSIAWR